MDSEFSDILKQGYVKIRRRHFWISQGCWLVFKKASGKGSNRLERYPNEQASNFHCQQKARLSSQDGHMKNKSSRYNVIDLTDVFSISRPPKEKKKYAVLLRFTDDNTLTFTCDSEKEAADWHKVLHRACVQDELGTVSSGEPDLLASSLRHQCERFRVCLLPCKGLVMSGECVLQVGSKAISLWDARNPRLKLASWPLMWLRRFGRDRTWFTFEAGRLCETGEGFFKFQTLEGEAIYQKVHTAVQSIIQQQDCPPR
ncbi:docking protein 5-like isoform X2 [Clupea harengus]|nr:docking protein 5-like isoform X2 [Clupea harengus]